jgi:hypothetical protein
MKIRKFFLVHLDTVILQFINMEQENKYIKIDIKVMKIGLNQELIPQGFRWLLWHPPTISASFQGKAVSDRAGLAKSTQLLDELTPDLISKLLYIEMDCCGLS